MKRRLRCHVCEFWLMHDAKLCPIEASDGSIPEWCPYHVTSRELEYDSVMRLRAKELRERERKSAENCNT